MYITNAFSIDMLVDKPFCERQVQFIGPMSAGALKTYLRSQNIQLVSAIGDASVAKAVATALGTPCPVCRGNIKLDDQGGFIVTRYAAGKPVFWLVRELPVHQVY